MHQILCNIIEIEGGEIKSLACRKNDNLKNKYCMYILY